MPSKKQDKVNKEKAQGDFETVTYTSSQLRTATTLLTVDDESVIIKSLDQLNKYVLEYCEYKINLVREEIVEKLHKTVESGNDVIIKLSLKLIGELLRDNKVKESALPGFKYSFIDRLCYFISEVNDEIIKEYSLFILLVLMSSERHRAYACTTGFALKLFILLETQRDPDVQKNTLEILCNLLNPYLSVWDALPPPDMKYPKLLLCYLIHEYKEMQILTARLLEQISLYQCSNFHQAIADCKTVEKMFEILQDPEREYLHESAKHIILNLVSYEKLSHSFIKSEEFNEYLKFIVTCTEKYLTTGCEILLKITSFVNFHESLFDFSADCAVLSMFRANDHKIQAGLCLIIKTLLSFEPFCEKLLTENSLKHIIEMLTQEGTFRTALVSIQGFLKNNNRTTGLLYKLNGFDKIFNIFLNNQSTDEDYFDIISDIVHTYCSIAAFSDDILTEEFCTVLLKRFKESPLSVIKLMNCYTHNEMFLNIFLENAGPKVFVDTIKVTSDEQVLKQIMIFVHALMAHKNICKRFLKDRLYVCLQNIPKTIRERVPLICYIEDKLYDMYLPLKFYVKGKLEISDKLESGFYLIDGFWIGQFPFLSTLFKEPVTTNFTVYTIDYGQSASQSSHSKELFLKSGQMEEKNYIVSEDALNAKDSISNMIMDTYFFALIVTAFKTIYTPANSSLGPIDRATMLALFVESRTSGCEEIETPEQHAHYYGYHIATLKRKLASNLIPIGYIRSGRYCERALLFKAIADRIGIPSTLVKGKNGLYWNEIPLPITHEEYMTTKTKKNCMVYGVVDLMENVGSILTVGSASAKRYCQIGLE